VFVSLEFVGIIKKWLFLFIKYSYKNVVMDTLKNILFIDIETVAHTKDFQSASIEMQEYWSSKVRVFQSFQGEKLNTSDWYEQKAGIYAEFAKIVCICIGRFYQEADVWKFAVKTIAHHNEAVLLRDFLDVLDKRQLITPSILFCGHNIREFDLPFICRRLLINGFKIPSVLQLSGKKPWEILHQDTLDLWKFGDYKHYISLALLAHLFAIPSPKDDICGSDVSKVYWQHGDLNRIATYCAKDVYTVAQVYLKLKAIALDPFPPFLEV
jgi:DNA polymerase elongation subunit (family B)